MKIIVTVGFANSDTYFEIDGEHLKKMLSMPIEKRKDYFFKHAEDAKVHSDNESEWYYDCSGNQSDQEFWESEGQENLEDVLER